MKLCIVDIIGPHYRLNIFKKIAAYWDSCWYFGRDNNGIKEIEQGILPNLEYVDNIQIFRSSLYYQTTVVTKLFDKDIKAFLVNGEPYCLSMWVMLLLRLLFVPHKKIYLWSHGWYGREGFVKKWIKRACSSLATGTFVYGNYARDEAIRQGNNPDKLWVIHNSLDYDYQKRLLSQINKSDVYSNHFENDCPVLLFIGRLTSSKKLDMLLHAVAILRDGGKNYNVVFIGNGPEKVYLEALAKSLNLNTWFYGACYDDAINAELIFNSDLCVSPGNVGLTAIHAMTFGTPVVTHDDFKWQMPEFEAIRPGVTGDFFQRDNVESLVHVIEHWFKSHSDRDLVRQACYLEIEESWTPEFQMEVFKTHIDLS